MGRRSESVSVKTYGTIYNGASDAIAGVTSQIKNLMFYDVNELYFLLRMANIVHSEAELKTWCDNNLAYSAPYVNYDITALIGSVADKVFIKSGAIATVADTKLVNPFGTDKTFTA